MRKMFNDPIIKKNIFTYSISGIIIVAAALILFNIGGLLNSIRRFIIVLSPFLWGLAFAFIMSKFANFLEAKLPDRMTFKWKRFISSFISVSLLVLVIAFLLMIIVPRLVDSISSLSETIMSFSKNATSWVDRLDKTTNIPKEYIEVLYEYANGLVVNIINFTKQYIPNILNYTIDAVSGMLDFVIGFVVALYMLIERDRIIAKFKKICKAYMSQKSYDKFIVIYEVSIAKFSKFFQGKLIDSIVIGILCFIAMLILKLDYAVLISVIVGITNIIPFFGPFIGAIPSVLILLISNPAQAFTFAILILIIQQLDGNVIGPYILGDSVGLSSLWIMFAIIVGGAYFGFFGMLLGVPIFSVLYYLLNEEVDKRLKKQKE